MIAGVRRLLAKAESATPRKDPRPSRVGNWWRGTLIEAAYQNVHAAEAEIVRLYDDAEVAAALPDAVARVEASLHRDDPRRRAAHDLHELAPSDRRAALLRAVEVGTAAGDRQHTRVRGFRNVVLVDDGAAPARRRLRRRPGLVEPATLPLCFTRGDTGRSRRCARQAARDRPARTRRSSLLMGALGGVLAAAVNIRNLRGTSTPYDVPVALSLLKVPAGALTALAALFAIRGQFVPGLSALDTQEQVLAYALVFGYAQQLLTRLIDRQAGRCSTASRARTRRCDRPRGHRLAGAPASGEATVAPAGSPPARSLPQDDPSAHRPRQRDGMDRTSSRDRNRRPRSRSRGSRCRTPESRPTTT